MEKNIWVITDNKKDALSAQRGINATGSMRAICVLSYEALEKLLSPCKNMPSLIVIDYEMSIKEEFRSLSLVKCKQILAGVPLFFMAAASDEKTLDECYRLGALAVLKKPFNELGVERIERMAWQFDVAKNTERKLEKQAMDLRAAREIERLNKQLEARNDLLYKVFGRYFSDEVMERIFNDPAGITIGGDKLDMTVMMADLRGFTAMSQSLDPDAMLDILNYYFSSMVEVITRYKGTVIEFLGDGILAVFGAPIKIEDHTENAIAAAIMMQNEMISVNEYCKRRGIEPLNMGVGIHRGNVFIGNIGSNKVMRYNVIGRIVNECSRVESFSVGGQVLVSDSTLLKLNCGYETREEIIEIKAKGVETPIKVYDVYKLLEPYECKIIETEEMKLYNVNREITVEIYTIIDKMVSLKPIVADVKAFSYKNAIVEYYGRKRLNLYTDVKVVAKDTTGKVLFDDVYAKVRAKSCEAIKLHFTHINGDFQYLIEQLAKEEEAIES
ncbi:MAG: adenylate/guanylate cyclase domain-containing response regulator [Lachnospira sp.]|nr:adenylate/guanylate cyclase domain-containing response regulator [Lachnospira sp.]